MKQNGTTKVARRDVLRALVTGAGAAAAGGAALATGAAAAETNDEKRKPRYRESEHVKTFYRVNRYPQS